jgi:hypothetical protein
MSPRAIHNRRARVPTCRQDLNGDGARHVISCERHVRPEPDERQRSLHARANWSQPMKAHDPFALPKRCSCSLAPLSGPAGFCCPDQFPAVPRCGSRGPKVHSCQRQQAGGRLDRDRRVSAATLPAGGGNTPTSAKGVLWPPDATSGALWPTSSAPVALSGTPSAAPTRAATPTATPRYLKCCTPTMPHHRWESPPSRQTRLKTGTDCARGCLE